MEVELESPRGAQDLDIQSDLARCRIYIDGELVDDECGDDEPSGPSDSEWEWDGEDTIDISSDDCEGELER